MRKRILFIAIFWFIIRFSLRKSVKKCVDFVDYLVVWCLQQAWRCLLRVGNGQKLHGVRSGRYEGDGDNSALVFLRYSCTSPTVEGCALSWCKIHRFFDFWHFQLTCHRKILKTKVIFRVVCWVWWHRKW